jgi:hypothetical protein
VNPFSTILVKPEFNPNVGASQSSQPLPPPLEKVTEATTLPEVIGLVGAAASSRLPDTVTVGVSEAVRNVAKVRVTVEPDTLVEEIVVVGFVTVKSPAASVASSIPSLNTKSIVVDDVTAAETTVGGASSTVVPKEVSSATFTSSVVAKFEPPSSLYVSVGVELVSPSSAVVKVIIQVAAVVITTFVTEMEGEDKTQSAVKRPAGIEQLVSEESTTIVVDDVRVTVVSAASNPYASGVTKSENPTIIKVVKTTKQILEDIVKFTNHLKFSDLKGYLIPKNENLI